MEMAAVPGRVTRVSRCVCADGVELVRRKMKVGCLTLGVECVVATASVEKTCRLRRVKYLARARITKGSAAVGRDKDAGGSAQECGGAN